MFIADVPLETVRFIVNVQYNMIAADVNVIIFDSVALWRSFQKNCTKLLFWEN